MRFAYQKLCKVGVLVFLASTLLLCVLPLHVFAASEQAGVAPVEISRSGFEARSDDIPFAVKDFYRSNKGTSKTHNGQSFGYRYPVVGAGAFVVVATKTATIVHIPAHVAQGLSIDLDDPNDREAFERLLEAIDQNASGGNQPLADSTAPYLYTTETRVVRDGLLYRLAVEVEPGQYYVCVTEEMGGQAPNDAAATGNNAPSDGALFVCSGVLVPADDVVIDRPLQGMEAIWEFFGGIDYRPFWVSMRTSLLAMVFVFVLGLLAAHFSLKINDRIRSILDSIFTIPMVLPPTVCGFLLLVVLGNSTGFGRWLIEHGISLVFTWPAAVIAAFVVAFPLMYRTARGAFEGLDPNLGDAARTLGWSDTRIFFRLTLPLCWPSIAAGTVLSFARALGEFGATLFVAGNYAGITQTMPLAIYFQWMGGHTDVATFWVVVVILISFLVILFINLYAAHTQRYRKVGADVDYEYGEENPSGQGHSKETRQRLGRKRKT
jgi:molybdate transport system permease protein